MLISVVTPCFNRATFVREAIESVLAQDHAPVEHVVADGGSTDGTLDVLRGYPHLVVRSEPDKNLYDAVNKGIRLARGEVIGFLNTDDYYAPNVFGAVAAAFAAAPGLDAVYGGAAFVEDEPGGGRRVVEEYARPEDLSLAVRQLRTCRMHVNARFFRRRVYDRVGLYDTRYRIAGDLDFLLRAGRANLTAVFLPRVVYYYRRHGGSLTFNNFGIAPTTARDVLAIAEKNLDGTALAGHERRELRAMHTTFSLGGLYYALQSGHLGTAAGFAARGLSRNLLWPAAFCQAGFNLVRKTVAGLPPR